LRSKRLEGWPQRPDSQPSTRNGFAVVAGDAAQERGIIHTGFILSAIGIAYVDRLSNIATEEPRLSGHGQPDGTQPSSPDLIAERS
jgi:hypothetical protein